VPRMLRRPTHPGELIREDFLPDYGLTPEDMALGIGVSLRDVEELLAERGSIDPEMALRLSRWFGNSAEFWMNFQHGVDLWDAERRIRPQLALLSTLPREPEHQLADVDPSGPLRVDEVEVMSSEKDCETGDGANVV